MEVFKQAADLFAECPADQRRGCRFSLPLRWLPRGMWWISELGTERSHDCDWAVPVRNVVLNDDGRAHLLDLVPNSWVEGDQVDLAEAWKSHARLRAGFRARLVSASSVASSSSGYQSAAIARS
jgi:hypothetical protein